MTKTVSRIAITTRVTQHDAYPEERDALSREWSTYLTALFPGVVVIPICNIPDMAERALATLAVDGVILSNGNGWGETPARDATETTILRYCRRTRTPVFGVCRGLQALNIAFGGTARQLDEERRRAHVAQTHSVTMLPGTPFTSLALDPEITVNSFHAQAVRIEDLASPLRPFAVSLDGIVEGLFHPEEPIIAVQWHPERVLANMVVDRAILSTLLTRTRAPHMI